MGLTEHLQDIYWHCVLQLRSAAATQGSSYTPLVCGTSSAESRSARKQQQQESSSKREETAKAFSRKAVTCILGHFAPLGEAEYYRQAVSGSFYSWYTQACLENCPEWCNKSATTSSKTQFPPLSPTKPVLTPLDHNHPQGGHCTQKSTICNMQELMSSEEMKTGILQEKKAPNSRERVIKLLDHRMTYLSKLFSCLYQILTSN